MPYQAGLAIGLGAKRYRIANAVLVYRDARRFIQEITHLVASDHTKLSDALERDHLLHFHKKVPLFVTTFNPDKRNHPLRRSYPHSPKG